jgi:hypothetical protein
MPTNNVYIRDLPYEFLKSKGDAFLDSASLTNHESIFIGAKASAPLMAAPKTKEEIPDVVLKSLRELIVRKYTDNTSFTKVEEDTLLMSYYYLQSKTILANDFKKEKKKLHPVTNKASNFKTGEPTLMLRRVLENPLVKKLRKGYTASPDKSRLKLRPEKTGKSVKDIVKSSKFYQETASSLVYDDVQYAAHVMNEAIRNAGVQGSFPAWVYEIPSGSAQQSTEYKFKYENVAEMVKLVRSLIEDKYNFGFQTMTQGNIDTAEILKESMLARLRSPSADPAYVFLKFETTGNDPIGGTYNFRVQDFSSDRYFLAGVLNYSSLEIDLNPRLSQDTVNSTLRFSPRAGDASVCILLGKDRTPFRISGMDKKLFNIDTFTVDEAMSTWTIDFDGADDNFVFQVESNGSIIAPASARLLSDSRIELRFRTAVNGKLYILSCAKNWPNDAMLVVTEENVERILATTNFHKKVYRKWIQ